MTALLVLVGGAVGAPLRYVVSRLLAQRYDTAFPWGTLVVNVAGSLVLGATAAAVAGGALPAWVLVLVGTGLCGALTTFSTFGYETVRLLERRLLRLAVLSSLGSLALGLAACAVGWGSVALLLGGAAGP